MDNNFDLPTGWAMLDDLAKKVSDTLIKKLISPRDELADTLEEVARDTASIKPDPTNLM